MNEHKNHVGKTKSLSSYKKSKKLNVLDALEKIDHTVCLAFNENNKALFNKDKYEHIDCKDINEFVECYDIIEKELKRLEEIDSFMFLNNKKIRAFEIIKEKKVNLEYLKCCETYEQYKTICSYWNEITQKEFNSLREALL